MSNLKSRVIRTIGAAFAGALLSFAASAPAAAGRLPPPGAIKHVMVIVMENESESQTFGPGSPAKYLNNVLLTKGEFVVNYFATSHVSLGNYVSMVSGQEPTVTTNNDCINLASLSHPPVVGSFNNVVPGTDAADQVAYPGQVVGDGCVYPAPTTSTMGAETIGDQLDAVYGSAGALNWREYAEDMGNDASRDYGVADPIGIGRDCAHPPVGGNDLTNTAEAGDQYADRHAPFVYFHSVIDNPVRCASHVVPLGVDLTSPTAADVFLGWLRKDLAFEAVTPRFLFVTPNLCDDGHDATCLGTNIEGGKAGGLVGADLWLKHYMPMIFNSPAYKDGSLLVVLTFDEASVTDARACANADQSTCGSPTGPNVSNPGYSTLLGLFGVQKPPTGLYQYAGGGQVGAVVFNSKWVKAGSVNTTGAYTHYSGSAPMRICWV